MSKVSGIGSYLFVNQYDLSGDVGAISSIMGSRNLQDISNIQQSAVQRLGLRRDGTLGFNSFFEAGAGNSHLVQSGIAGAQSLFTWAQASTLGARGASLVAREADLAYALGADGSLGLTATAQADGYGIEWIQMLTTGKQTIASAASGTSIDDLLTGTSTAFGLVGYLHAISLGSGTATVAIQDSADNSSFANVSGAVFTAVTGATSQRIQTGTSGTVRRYLRVNVTGTFTNLVCAVSVGRYLVSSLT